MTKASEFWWNVRVSDPSECWLWQGTVIHGGYGSYEGTTAHRYAWELTFGDIRHESLKVCHACDNTLCVNPEHLLLGSNRANILDSLHKSRKSKHLTPSDVRKVFSDYANGVSVDELAKRENVLPETIVRALSGESWQSLGLEPLYERRRHYKRKNLSREAVLSIRMRHAEDNQKWSASVLAGQYGLSVTVVSNILKGVSYASITGGTDIYVSHSKCKRMRHKKSA